MSSPRRISKPTITFSSVSQLLFTFREVTKIAARINLKALILIFLLNGLWGFSTLPSLYLEKLIIDNLLSSIGSPNIQAAVFGVSVLVSIKVGVELFRSFLSRVSRMMSRTFSLLFETELENLMASKLVELDIATIEDPEFKDRFTKIQRESGRRAWGLMMPLSDIPNSLVGFLSSISILILLQPLITLGILLVSLPQFFIDSKFIKKDYDLSAELAPHHKKWGWFIYYLVRNRNFMEVKLLSLQGYLLKELKKVQDYALSRQIALRKKRVMSNFGGTLPLVFFELALSVWLILLVVTQRITLGSFQLYLRALHNAQADLTSLVSSFLEIYENYMYVVDLVWFLNLKPQIDDNIKGGDVLGDGGITIEFKNVWFRYRKDQAWILKDVSFSLNEKENVALVGVNGAGKSTIIKILSRFYDPQKGQVFINNKDIKDYNIHSWRKLLAILFQEFELYPFSVKDTVGYGDVDRVYDIEGIKEVISATGMRNYVEGLELGYDNPLDPQFEKGVRPSIGQMQRFGISRMLFRKNSQVLIMDEPTSNVDPEAEEKIFKELVKVAKNKILMFVTQRFSTVRIADKIIVLEKGKIIETGSHKELIHKPNGRYRELFELQAKGYK